MNKLPITAKGAERLKQQLQDLKKIERPRITQAIAEARAHGDLSENAEYHAAREQQSFIEGRINEIETALAHAQVIDVNNISQRDSIVFGATVTLHCLEDDKEVIYQIVGQAEADIEANLVSIVSPIARALIGKQKTDIVQVDAPNGVIKYEVLNIQYI